MNFVYPSRSPARQVECRENHPEVVCRRSRICKGMLIVRFSRLRLENDIRRDFLLRHSLAAGRSKMGLNKN